MLTFHPFIRGQTMNSALHKAITCIATIMAAAVVGSSVSLAEGATQIAVCVEISAAAHPTFESRKRRHTEVDCDPQAARLRAFRGARAAASKALQSHCRAHVLGVQAARDICLAANLAVPTAATSVSRPAVPAFGTAPIDESFGIGTSKTGIRVCTVLRNLPGESQTTTQAAGAAHGFCIFNGNKTTRVTARARARCGVQCI
jgi:hypothetical protein